ncbi:33980_t:CDS:1, partial [Gigaspora margarita]
MPQKMQAIQFEHIDKEISQELGKRFEVFCAKLLKIFEKYGAVIDY